jgi:lipoate-protein ligase A
MIPCYTPTATLFSLNSGLQSGAHNMAMDEQLLEWVRALPTDSVIWIIRTYQWRTPTLSLGVHQPERDWGGLWRQYGTQTPSGESIEWVKRPTGGRAILHGEDLAFSFLSNDPALLTASLNDSYALMMHWMAQTLSQLGVPVATSQEASGKAYTRSAICFETHTPSDLLSQSGQKLAGSAQLRRAGGLLQHGSAFVKDFGIAHDTLSQQFFQTVAQAFGRSRIAPFEPDESFQAQLAQRERDYIQASGEILEKASTTAGSHLEPASR